MTAITPNLQLIYVANIERSTKFYKRLLKSEPVFESPRYVAFSAGGESIFSIWSGGSNPDINTPRFSEIGIMLSANEEVDDLFNEWLDYNDIKILEAPRTEIFGRTFVIQDPDGHLIRVCKRD